MKKRFFSLAAALLFLPASAFSSELEKADSAVLKENMVVTATRTSAELGRCGGASMSVITSEDIKASGKLTVQDLLKTVPGVHLTSNGGLGAGTSIFMRGADSKNVLVLIDGIMLNDASDSNRGANISTITTDNIERVEIVRGPQSVLYGSNATAGVINIITKSGKAGSEVYAGGEYGSYSTWKAFAGVSGALKKFDYSLNVSRLETDGFSSVDEDNNRMASPEKRVEDDGHENTTVSGKIGFEVTDDMKVNLVARHVDSKTYEDDWYADTSSNDPNPSLERRGETEETYGRIELNNFFMDRVIETRLGYSLSTKERDYYHNSGAFNNSYDSRTDEIGFQTNVNFKNNTLSLGISHSDESMEKTGLSEKDETINSVWLQDQFFLGEEFDLVAGARLDDHERFGDEITYRISPSYTFSCTGTTIKGSLGTGFRAPSLFELYDPVNGSPGLTPEKSIGWDLGFEQSLLAGKVTFGTTWFKTNYEDRIDWAYTGPGPYDGKYFNLEGESESQGLESFVNYSPMENLSFRLNHTYTHAVDADDNRLCRRPLNKITLNSRYRWNDKLLLNLDVLWTGERDTFSKYGAPTDKDGNKIYQLDDYTVVNISAVYEICPNFSVNARIENLFDEYYEDIWGYGTSGFAAYAGFRVSY